MYTAISTAPPTGDSRKIVELYQNSRHFENAVPGRFKGFPLLSRSKLDRYNGEHFFSPMEGDFVMDAHKPDQPTVDDDPKAREALRRAFENTARWPQGFKGFTADLTVNIGGKTVQGPVIVKGPQEVSVQLADGDVQKWAQDQLKMIAVHRGPRSFEESDGKYTLTMEEDGHPLGTRLDIRGSNSFYRLKDNRITQINRTMAHPGMPAFAFTINIEDSAVTQDNKYLTTRYTVYYFSPADGKLKNVESFTDAHVRVGACDLPGSRRIIAFENGTVVVKHLNFLHHQLL
jgi:hypothetical protein